MRFQLQVVQPVARPIILTHFDQAAPYRKYRHSYSGELGRPSLDLEKMQQVSTPSYSYIRHDFYTSANLCQRDILQRADFNDIKTTKE